MASTINGVTTTFVGNHYEVMGRAATKYYFAGASRVAMRQNVTLFFLLSDHLGSTSLTTDANGNKVGGLRYNAWGAVRHADVEAWGDGEGGGFWRTPPYALGSSLIQRF